MIIGKVLFSALKLYCLVESFNNEVFFKDDIFLLYTDS